MHVSMTQAQFEELKKKAKSGGTSKGNGQDKDKDEKTPKIKIKEDDDTHGFIDTDDVMLAYFYNATEARLNFSIAKKHTLAAYCAGDNIAGTFVMDILSSIPSPKKESGEGDTKGTSGSNKDGEQEKKDQPQHQSQ